MTKLVKAIEVSLTAAEAAREAVQEILKRGAETGIFFSGARASGAKRAEHPFELTPQDREFLRAILIRPDPR
jgi:glycine cleavage system aminomethyltransferase T